MESDEELIRRIRSGEREALAILYERYFPSVWRYVRVQLRGDEPASRDVVSDTFLHAVRLIGAFDGRAGTVSGGLMGSHATRSRITGVRARELRIICVRIHWRNLAGLYYVMRGSNKADSLREKASKITIPSEDP